jgi:hypothetical protein
MHVKWNASTLNGKITNAGVDSFHRKLKTTPSKRIFTTTVQLSFVVSFTGSEYNIEHLFIMHKQLRSRLQVSSQKERNGNLFSWKQPSTMS